MPASSLELAKSQEADNFRTGGGLIQSIQMRLVMAC